MHLHPGEDTHSDAYRACVAPEENPNDLRVLTRRADELMKTAERLHQTARHLIAEGQLYIDYPLATHARRTERTKSRRHRQSR